MNLDEFQDSIGGISRYQICIIAVSTWLAFAAGPMMSSGIYMSATPVHRCTLPKLNTSSELSESDLNDIFIPWDDAQGKYSSCQRYDYDVGACSDSDNLPECLRSLQNHTGIIHCDDGYQYETDVFINTPVSQFNLVCGDKSFDSLANTLFFLGFFIGSLYIGPLADWFGRKTAMRVTCLGLAICGTLTAFTTTYTSYVALRIATASFNITLYICFFTYVNEITTTKLRTVTVILDNCSVALSHILFPWMCYALGDWRYIHTFISCLCLPFLVTSFFIPETPRWLATKGKYNELREVLSKYAKSNGKVLTEETWIQIKSQAENSKRADSYLSPARNVAVWDLFKRPMMRLMSMNTMFMWFTVAMVYYGLILNGGRLSGDFYINNTLNSAVEVIGDTAIALAVVMGRKKLLCIALMGAGVFCISSMITKLNANGVQAMITASTALVITGKAFGAVSFGLIYMVTCEIFPTEARATAISMGSMASRIGSMLSPFILQINDIYPWFTQTVFGSLSIIAGMMTFLFPETNGVEFSSSLDEAETFYRENMSILKAVGFTNHGYHKGRTHKKENKPHPNKYDITSSAEPML